jgi:hypothetical protein
MRNRAALGALGLSCFLVACPEDQVSRARGILGVAPLEIDFGTVPLAVTRIRQLELSNSGDGALSITISVSGQRNGLRLAFENIDIVPGEKKILQLDYVPESLEDLAAELRIADDLEDTTDVIVPVRGHPVASPYVVEPASLDFGNVRRGRTSEKTFVVKNLLDEELSVLLENIAGSNAEDFRRDGLNLLVVPANGEVQVSIIFAPSELGAESAHLELDANCNVACRERVTFSGVGVESSLSCLPPAIDFRAINPGDCKTRSVDCTNPETSPLSITRLDVESTTPELSARTQAPLTVPAGGSVSLEVDYCPADLGSDQGRLRIQTREPDGGTGMLSIQLRGEGGGPDVSVSPRSLVFGAAIGNIHRREILIENTGFTVLEVESYRLDPPEAPFRVVTPPAPAAIQVGEAIDLVIEFAPGTEEVFEANLVIVSNDGDEEEVTVDLRGTGLAPVPCQIEVVPSELAYGLVQVGGRYTRQITLRAVGDDSCAYFEPRLERGELFQFDMTPPESGTISRNMNVSFEIVYRPVVGSPISGDEDVFLVEVPNETPSTVRVPIHGLAAPADLVVLPSPVDFGLIQTYFPRERTVTIYNVGPNTHVITSLEKTLESSNDFAMTSTPSVPVTINPGGSLAIDLTYRSPDIGSDSGSLEITSNALPAPILVDLFGQAGDDDCGHVTGIICSPDGENASVGATVIVETTQGTFSTITDENGAYYLYCLPPGRIDVTFLRGHFRGIARAEIVAHETTVIEEPSCLEPGSANIAVITGSFDHVEDILEDLGIPHEIYDGFGALPVLEDLALLQTYDILFMNCGMNDGAVRDPLIAGNLQAFVDGGGSIYASDWAYDAVEGAWPPQVDFAGDDLTSGAAQSGFNTQFQGQVLDPAILARLGGQSLVTVTFAGGYVVIDAAAASTLVHVVGETLGPGTGLRPLLVSFVPGLDSGKVVYTSFHNTDVFLDAGMRIVLEYLIFEL